MARPLKRGDIVIVSAPGDYGKPRPAVVVQSDWLAGTESVLIALVTGTLRDTPLFRLTLEPSPSNGLAITSQVMVDKILAIPRTKCGSIVGRIDTESLLALDRSLSVVFGLAD